MLKKNKNTAEIQFKMENRRTLMVKMHKSQVINFQQQANELNRKKTTAPKKNYTKKIQSSEYEMRVIKMDL